MTFESLRTKLSLPETQVQEALDVFQAQKPDGTPVQFLRFLQKGGLIEVEEVLQFLTSSRVDVSTAHHNEDGVQSDDDVVANFEGSGFAEGEVRIRSNDAENRDLRIPVCGVTADYTEPYNCGEENPSADTGTADTGTVDTGATDSGTDDSGSADTGT